MSKLSVVFYFLFFSISHVFADVKLPRLVSNGMVLQQDESIKIWGWADENEKISIRFLDKEYNTSANKNGDWEVIIPEQKAGGPYNMKIEGNNTIHIENILIGEVWVCSGQSNMELPIYRVAVNYPGLVENSHNPLIRHFAVNTTYAFKEKSKDFLSGEWLESNTENVKNFSAVGYFFAKSLFEKYQVPIGLIRIAVGGSPAEAWLSEETLVNYPKYYNLLQKYKDAAVIDSIKAKDAASINNWNRNIDLNDIGLKSVIKWFNIDYNTKDWKTTTIPGYWHKNLFVLNESEQHMNVTGTGNVNGVVWFKKEVDVPANLINKDAMAVLGAIVDRDEVYLNGKLIGSTGYQYPPRRYQIPSNLLKAGKNTIVVRVVSNTGRGGFVPDKFYGLTLGKDTIKLNGDWQYQLGYQSKPMPGGQITFHYQPASLFNAMVAPLLNYKFKGVIWYQGESNTSNPQEYAQLFKDVILDWRKFINNKEFPFLFVQLANFMDPSDAPLESKWAEVREVQRKTLSVPSTGMAVAIDIGEWNDIHPLNKKDVGDRLSLNAQKLAYKENNVVYSGPIYQSMKIKKDKIILKFDLLGSKFLVKEDQKLKQFSIAGTDKNFVRAEAKIKGNKVIVSSSEIKNPKTVRYAWADNPVGANLYNKEGLPSSPFSTDK
jgi:sialate O-acetylesterase